jgi:RNA polymerase sigma-70 factor (ECF subfamily)
LLARFIEAAARGDRKEIMSLFANEAVMLSDGGGKAIAALRPLHGAERIAWLWYAVARRTRWRAQRHLVQVNGEWAIASFYEGRLHSVATIDTDGERILGFFTIANPDKLSSFRDLVTRLGIAAS